MSNLYGYSSSYGAGGGGGGGTPKSSAAAALSSVYTSRSLTDPYHLSDSALRYDPDHSIYDTFRYSGYLSTQAQQPWPPGVDPTDHLKRSSEAKRPRIESASNLPVYPQRPGEKDCAHYMQTRTCKFGDTCKFDHPIWVPEGGIPDWKEVPVITSSEYLPERPGEVDCPYFLKTQRCKFGFKCKFNHPKDKLITSTDSGNGDASALPERPSEPPCAFYLKSGTCKFGATCKFHHPKDFLPPAGQENGTEEQNESVVKAVATTGHLNPVTSLLFHTPAMLHNSKGLPIRPGELDCPFYLKTGSCKYGCSCRYNHPERSAINPPAAAIVHPLITSPVASLGIGVVSPAASIYQTIDPRLAQATLGIGSIIYPQRPGQMECDYYMKTGVCKFGEKCRFHHPIDRSAAIPPSQDTVKLTLAGLPSREGSVHCPYYMKTGSCKYGATCKFDHPPPGEVMSVSSDGTATAVGEEVRGYGKEDNSTQAQQQ